MLSLLKNFFGSAKRKATPLPGKVNGPAEHSNLVPSVEVANLRLNAILARLPDELKPLVLKQPDDSVTVALPVATIVKQLPSGSVKVSLATLHRQAPAGVLGPLPSGDKQMVDVPLAEVFRHIKPTIFKRRQDQKTSAGLDSEFNLFGDAQNPHQVAPTVPGEDAGPVAPPAAPRAFTPLPAAPAPAPARPTEVPQFKLTPSPLVPSPARVLTSPSDFSGLKLKTTPVPVEPATPVEPAPPAPPVAPAPAPVPAAPTVAPKIAEKDSSWIQLPVAPLSAAWPEPIRNAIAGLNGSAQVALPPADVTAGLAKGKVVFTWGQIRAWIEPALEASPDADEATELSLPLKVVAPAFLAATRKPKVEQRPADIDPEIPALFNNARAEVPASIPVSEAPAALAAPELPAIEEAPAEVPAIQPVDEIAVESAGEFAAAPVEALAFALVQEPAAAPTDEPVAALVEVPAAAPADEHVAAPVEEPAAAPAAEQVEVPVEAPIEAPAAEVAEAPVEEPLAQPDGQPVAEAAAEPAQAAETVGELFGHPEKLDWSPGELVAQVAKLPGVAGAVVALQEGLLVAHSMPGDVKSEVIAAFLPQLFARLNQYSGEMKLGEVDDLLFTTHGAHCQIYRLGFVYFAVLGHPGQSLPWNELRLVANELARQTQQS